MRSFGHWGGGHEIPPKPEYQFPGLLPFAKDVSGLMLLTVVWVTGTLLELVGSLMKRLGQ